MSVVEVTPQDGNTYLVSVSDTIHTEHRVTVNPDYAKRFLNGESSVEELVAASFKFLLEREPNTSILREFELSIINNYFPEYEDRIREYL